MDQRLRSQRLDQVYVDGQLVLAGRQMFRPDANGQFPSVRAWAAAIGEADRRPGVEAGGGAAIGQCGGQKIHRGRANEAGDVGVGRALEHLHRGGELRGAALMQHQQAVAQRHRLDLVVRHIEAGDAEAALQTADFGAHLHPQLGIEVRQRLIEQEQFGGSHDGTPHRHPLALAARELPRLAGQQFGQAQHPGGFVDAALDVVFG